MSGPRPDARARLLAVMCNRAIRLGIGTGDTDEEVAAVALATGTDLGHALWLRDRCVEARAERDRREYNARVESAVLDRETDED